MRERILTQFAETSAPSGGIVEALGIDWQMLVFQIIGFLVLVWLMSKFVYPVLIKQVDKRQALIEESTKAAVEAEKNAVKAEEKIKALLSEARKEAADIVTTAKNESNQMVSSAEQKAKENAERIVTSAHESIEKDIIAAKKALHNETLELVALATEKVVGKTVDAKVDAKVVESALKEAK